jgi:hypothetical protein
VEQLERTQYLNDTVKFTTLLSASLNYTISKSSLQPVNILQKHPVSQNILQKHASETFIGMS